MLTREEIRPLIQAATRQKQAYRAFIEKDFPAPKAGHILKMADIAAQIHELGPAQKELLVWAALLHDIGYHPALVETGFHPLDGAAFLEESGEPELATLVACHSSSPEEAAERNLPIPRIVSSDIADLLSYLDWHITRDGEIVSFEERLDDIFSRYGEESVVTRSNRKAKDRLAALIARVDAKFPSLRPLLQKPCLTP